MYQCKCEEVYLPKSKPSLVIFLVHGTFAKKAEWTSVGSKLCTTLRRNFPYAAIYRFLWSGENSMPSRFDAATRLVVELQASVKQHPEVAHVVIAHSHGGNIALQALSHADLNDVSLICLSTPVLHAIPRVPIDEGKSVLPLAVFVGLSTVIGFGLAIQRFLSIQIGEWPFLFFTLALTAAVVGAVRIGVRWAESPMLANVTLSDIASERVLFVRYVGDEASFGLTAFQFVQYLVRRIAESCLAIFGMFGRTFFEIIYSLVPTLVVGVLVFNYASRHSFWGIGDMILHQPLLPHWIKELLLETVPTFLVHTFKFIEKVLIYSFFGLGTISVVLIALLVGCAVIPFGPTLAVMTIFVEINVEAAPPGMWRVTVLIPPATSKTRFKHSYSYEEIEAREAIVREIVNRVSPSFIGPK